MVPCKFIVFLAVAVACVAAAPSLTEEVHPSPPLPANVENSDESLIQPPTGSPSETQESRVKKDIIAYDGFAYTYPTIPLVSSYSYQYHRAFPYAYAYSAPHYPYPYAYPVFY